MSKSIEGSYINLTDNLSTIRKRLAAAVTDTGTTGGEVPKEGPIANLFTLLKLFVPPKTVEKFSEDYRKGSIKYKELKEILAERIYENLLPIQQRRKYYEENPRKVAQILTEGRIYCQKIAQETLAEVRKKMGFVVK